MIYHIYWGTSGNAGLYTDEIYQTLDKAGYKQKAFVSSYYPFDYGEKVFFKRTEMEHCHYRGLLRKLMQALELVYALIMIWINAKRDKPQVVNYSYVSRGNSLILFFLKQLKKIRGLMLVITCHDVIPIIDNKAEYNKEIAIKKRIYSLADYYIVHTDNSKKELLKLFQVTDSQVLIHPFPLMDLSKLDKKGGERAEDTEYVFLFIGHMRPEKGVDILYNAWMKFHELYPDSKLCIAGNPNYYKDFLAQNADVCKQSNITLKLGFIKDDDYIRIVKSARCVIFPYTGGTNSGVISTVVSLSRDVITSDIGMFTDNPFVPSMNMFKAGDSESLLEKLCEYMKGTLVSDSKARVDNYRELFEKQVAKVYATIYGASK